MAAARGTGTYRPRWAPVEKGKDDKPGKSDPSGRLDGRKQFEMRSAFMKVGAVSRATGSAYVETVRLSRSHYSYIEIMCLQNNVKVVCGVYGPTSNERTSYSDKGQLSCSFEFSPFAREKRRSRDDEQLERAISLMVEEALTASIQLDKFPKAVVKVWVVVLEGKSGYLGAAVTCASLALA
eukprot:1319564-Amorphochlora_amoeboformis.AAC.2